MREKPANDEKTEEQDRTSNRKLQKVRQITRNEVTNEREVAKNAFTAS